MKTLSRLSLFLSLLIGATRPADASLIFQLGNHPGPNQENVLFDNEQTGNPVFGETQTSAETVIFSSTTDTLFTPSSGQARVEAVDGNGDQVPLNNLSIEVLDSFYLGIVLNPSLVGSINDAGPAHVTVFTNMGIHEFDYALGSGSNFLSILASGGERILKTTIDADFGFADLRQPRLSGVSVPEPASLTLVSLGAFGLVAGAIRRRRPLAVQS